MIRYTERQENYPKYDIYVYTTCSMSGETSKTLRLTSICLPQKLYIIQQTQY